jgi:hypothetical protein
MCKIANNLIDEEIDPQKIYLELKFIKMQMQGESADNQNMKFMQRL